MKKVVSIIIALAASAAFIGGAYYLLSNTGMFDQTGSFIKDKADDKDTLGFIEQAERPDFYKLVKNPDDFMDKPLRFYAIVRDSKEHNDGSDTYTLEVLLNNEEERAFKNMEEIQKDSDGYSILTVIAETDFESSNFYSGDEVEVYGSLTEVGKEDKVIIYLEGRKFYLETEE